MRVKCSACFKGLPSLAGEVTALMPPSLLRGVLSGHRLRGGVS